MSHFHVQSPLEYNHLGDVVDLDGEQFPVQAEVGLLTRNVVFRGNVNTEWNEEIEACPAGFDSGLFVVDIVYLKHTVLYCIVLLLGV